MILVDTGPIVALINARDDRHAECRSLLERLSGPLLVPATWRPRPDAVTEDLMLVISTAPTDAPPATRARWLALFLDGLTAGAPSTTD